MTGAPVGRTVPGNRWDLLDGQWPSPAPRVSVVVAHFEQQRELDRTLAALARQTHPRDRLEVVIVDDGSARPPRVPAGVRLLQQEDRGFRAAAARNLGAAAATGDVLCFLDADTTPEPDYVRRLTRLPAIAPEVVAVGRREHADLGPTAPDGPVELVAPPRRLASPGWLADAYATSRNLLDADQASYRFVISSVLACSRWFFEVVGGFDETFETYGGEDWEWAMRAWDQGAVLAHEPAAVAWHDGPDWASRVDARARARTKNVETLALLRRHSRPGARPRALRMCAGDVEVRLSSSPSDAALLVAVDAALVALPQAAVLVAPDRPWVTAHDDRVRCTPLDRAPRLVVRLEGDVRVQPEDLAAAVDAVQDDDLGVLTLVDDAGHVVGSVAQTRALRRAARWGREDLFASATRVVRSTAIPEDPDLEAYVGGWS